MKPTEMLAAEQAAATDPARDHSKPLPSFAVRDLAVLHYANGFTLWHAKVPKIGNLMSSNYFGPCADMLSAGDHMHVSAPDGNAVLAIEKADKTSVSVRVLVA